MTHPIESKYDAVVLGAGFFGLRIAQFLRESGLARVAILEAEPTAMERASYVNQARVHNGYHYPRSILTAFRSRVSSRSFASEYESAIFSDFEHIYAIASSLSKTNAKQFEAFCERIGAPLQEAPPSITHSFSERLIEKSWIVEEVAFDSRELRNLILRRIASLGGIEIVYREAASRVRQSKGMVCVETKSGMEFNAPIVISSLYAATNELHQKSGLALLPLQHEITEMALVKMPELWRNRALTVMDGPFFSMVPFPSENLHTLSHVRYTPQVRWEEHDGVPIRARSRESLEISRTTFREMKADLNRYVSGFEHVEYVKSIREVKTVLAKNDLTDSRPIIVRTGFGIDGYYCVLGGKIDNVADVIDELGMQLGI